MAKCPKCGYKLKLTDINQCCPECGTNMRLYGFEETFYREAKTAELSQAKYSCKIRRLKMSFIGSKLAIARLIVMILPLAALIIPAANVCFDVPFRKTEAAVSALGIYNMFSGGEFNFILSMSSGNPDAAAFASLRLVLFVMAAAALMAVAVLLLSILCFFSIKNMQKITSVFAVLGMIVTVVDIVCLFRFISAASGSTIMSASGGFGLYVVFLMFAVVFGVNFALVKKGIPVEYPEGAVERSEIWDKVRSGEINIDDLPYPVVETAETRKVREEIESERKSYAENVIELSREEGGVDSEE